MIELFNLINEQRKKTIRINCDHVSYWRSGLEQINELVEYIRNHMDKFCVETFKVEYNTVFDDRYVQSFDIVVQTDQKTYDYISNNFTPILEKYDKRIIDLRSIKFYPLSENHKITLH